MIYFYDTTDFYIAGPSVVTLGKFDGVHLGHRKLFRAVKQACRPGDVSAAFVFNANHSELLMTEKEQYTAIEEEGMDCLVRCPFVPEISGMTPDAFITEILKNRLHAHTVIVGSDFRFGHNRQGDAAYLQSHADYFDLDVRVIEKEKFGERDISSTYIREALAAGNMELVSALMGRNYPVNGTIIHGKHLGSSLGMPTCNLIPESEKLTPPNGVYFSRNTVNGHVYNGVTNIGYKPTVDGTFRGVETYLYDCSENLYGQPMQVELLHFKRPELKFDSIKQLSAQVHSDMADGETYFRELNK